MSSTTLPPNNQDHQECMLCSAASCSQGINDLLIGFFEYFGNQFNWGEDAVCPRLNQEGAPIKKCSLDIKVNLACWAIMISWHGSSFCQGCKVQVVGSTGAPSLPPSLAGQVDDRVSDK